MNEEDKNNLESCLKIKTEADEMYNSKKVEDSIDRYILSAWKLLSF